MFQICSMRFRVRHVGIWPRRYVTLRYVTSDYQLSRVVSVVDSDSRLAELFTQLYYIYTWQIYVSVQSTSPHVTSCHHAWLVRLNVIAPYGLNGWKRLARLTHNGQRFETRMHHVEVVSYEAAFSGPSRVSVIRSSSSSYLPCFMDSLVALYQLQT